MGEAAAAAAAVVAATGPQDLRVTVAATAVVMPLRHSSDAVSDVLFLSNIDQVLNFPVETVHFFRSSPGFQPVETAVVGRLRSALERLLAHPYEFLSGRLRAGADGRLEIECNGKGAVLVAAESELRLEELGDLACPSPALRQLVSWEVAVQPAGEGSGGGEDRPLCIIQVTSFKCGGFAMGVCTNHITFDGISFAAFLRHLAAAAGGGPVDDPPCHDRRLLAARSPPHVDFPHPELLSVTAGSILEKPPSADNPSAELRCRIFSITEKDISFLKHKAAASGAAKASSFNVVTAHLWRCRALATDPSERRMETSMVLFAVDLRARLDPPLPKSFAGNAVLSAYGSLTYDELGDEDSFGRVVEAVQAGTARMDDAYARSVIDWGDLNKGFPVGNIFVSSWWRLGFADIEYPWGKPIYSGPVADPSKDIVLLFPPGPGESGKAAGPGGVNAQVALPADEMEKFEEIFAKFLHR